MEIWKEIKGYEGLYEVSNTGRIRKINNKAVFTELHGIQKLKQRILKTKVGKDGRLHIGLYKNGKRRMFLVHRLVAFTFLNDDYNRDITVNHKDGNPKNNHIENLEIISLKDNIKHAIKIGLKPAYKVFLKNKKTLEIKLCETMVEASEFIGKSREYLSRKRKNKIKSNALWEWKFEAY